MKIAKEKQYEVGNGVLKICRHFGDVGQPSDLIRESVIQSSFEGQLLTDKQTDAILSPSLREPQLH